MKKLLICLWVLLFVAATFVSCNDSAKNPPEDTQETDVFQETEGADEKQTEPPITLVDDCKDYGKEHSWKEWKTVVPSTCTVRGEQERACFNCRVTEKQAAPLHNLVVNAARSVTCTRKGWDKYVACKDCNYSTYREIAPLDHNYENNFCKNCGRTALSMGLIRGEAVAFGIGCYEGNHIVIPAQHKGYPVTQIGLNSFPELYGIEAVTLPATIVGMYPFCFQNCYDLRRVYAPKGIEKLVEVNFDGCKKLSRVYYLNPEELETFTPSEEIENLPCYVDVENIHGMMTVVGIGNYLGDNIVLPETYGGLTISAIADGAFENCDHIKSVVMPRKIEKIGSRAFAGCTDLREVIFDNSNNGNIQVEIAHDAFEGCSDIHLEMPWDLCKDLACFDEAVTKATIHTGIDGWVSIYPNQKRRADDDTENGIEVSCVKYFKNLETLVIGDDVVGIWDHAFQHCNNFKTLIISGNVMKMGISPFESCGRLQKVVLKKGVSAISTEAFKDCFAIKECIVEGPYDWSTTDDLTNPRTAARWLTSMTIKKRPFKY